MIWFIIAIFISFILGYFTCALMVMSRGDYEDI